MGITPQTHANALKPYGLIYELLDKHQVEVKWIINSSKEKDAADFTHDSITYRTGAFIVPVSYLKKDILTIIDKWEEKGVKGNFAVSQFEVPVFSSLSVAPKWTLDEENGEIALTFFEAAGIPETAYGGNNPAAWKKPEDLGVCDDIFVMPHADPEFETHKNLYVWNRDYKGAIWAGCHAVSIMENMYGTVESDEDSEELIQLNFLSAGFPGARSAGLIHYRLHRDAIPPYTHSLPADPVAQYLGQADEAHLNGSERVFFPKLINEWRKGTKKLVTASDAPDIPSKSKGEAAITIYGHGFDDPDRGLVMYQAGHDIFGDTEDHVAALRTFFNWSFYASEIKRKGNLIKFTSLNAREPIVAAKIGDDLAEVLDLNTIHFNLDEDEIREDAYEELDRIADFMKKYPELLVDVRSHTDSRANDEYNLKLSERRVASTIAYLRSRGIGAERISGRGYGETELLNKCENGVDCDETLHEKNRRSEFILSVNCKLFSGNLKIAAP